MKREKKWPPPALAGGGRGRSHEKRALPHASGNRQGHRNLGHIRWKKSSQPIEEPADQTAPDDVALGQILDVVVEVGVVVDLDDDDAGRSLLDVDAVEAVAHEGRRRDRDLDDGGWCGCQCGLASSRSAMQRMWF